MYAESLESELRTVEPAVRLVPERHLLKLLYTLRDRGSAVPANADMPFWATNDDLRIAEMQLDDQPPSEQSRFLLLTKPDDRLLDRLTLAEQLRAYWRLLFQAAVMSEIDRQIAEGTLTVAAATEWLMQFGAPAEREIRYVLQSDRYIDTLANSVDVFRVFAAIYLDLHAFERNRLAEFFPSLTSPDVVIAQLGVVLDAPKLLNRCRPTGAADAEPLPPPDESWVHQETGQRSPMSVSEIGSLLKSASDAELKGNLVRAAILRTRAASGAEDDVSQQAFVAAEDAIAKLVDQLSKVLSWEQSTSREWRQALQPLLIAAAQGIWPRAARCLYELQTIARELGREVYAVDLVEPIRTLGRRPVKRPLPHAPTVIRAMHLRAAQKQLLRAELGENPRLRLDRLLQHELHRAEQDIRHNLSPIIATALLESGFLPMNRVEEVARDKVVAEILDRVCERGFLRIGDFRDAIARNQLKMPDLAGPREFFTGDPLLRADTQLAYDLDGVYRRGEVYLRCLQRLSSVFFGSPFGRTVTLYLIGPFLAAFLTLMFVEELRHIGSKGYSFVAKRLGPKPVLQPAVVAPSAAASTDVTGSEPMVAMDEETNFIIWVDADVTSLARSVATSSAESTKTPDEHHSVLIAWPTVVGFGLFLLLVFHVAPFRHVVFSILTSVIRMIRLLFWKLPRTVWQSKLFVSIRHSAPVRFVNRHLRAPLLLSLLALLTLFVVGVNPRVMLRSAWAVPVILILAYNTPWGWLIQDRITEAVSDWWRVIRVNLIPGMIGWLIDVFRAFANWVERRLYAVDEWLRFRGGESQGSLALKATLGLVWFPFAYLTRFAFYLLLEPQINPIKHFPVVTVSHKVILPLTPSLAEALNVSEATAAGLLGCIPGIFGFMAWELMANWQLYRANRPDRLNPVVIGSHGESMRGLLRPGFHSGTVAKLYRKLRRTDHGGERSPAARLHHELDHVAEAVHRFVERDFVALLMASPEWGGLAIVVASIRFGCQRVVIELAIPTLGKDALVVTFENRAGLIDAAVNEAVWLDKLTHSQRTALMAAIRGLFDMGAARLHAELNRDTDRPTIRVETGASLNRPYTWSEWVQTWTPKT